MKELKAGQIGCFSHPKYDELHIYEESKQGMNVGLVAVPFELTAEQKTYIQGSKRPAVEELERIISNFYQMEEALIRLKKEMRLCMGGYRRAVYKGSNYDIAKTPFWECFNESMQIAGEAIKKAGGK